MNAVSDAVAQALAPIRLDIGAGSRKQPGYTGVDIRAFDGVDVVLDVRQTPWPWADDSVEEIYSSHFVEHLTREEWIPFFNEAGRVLKPKGKMTVIVPNWSHACAYGDPTHKSFCSGWMANYLNAKWRSTEAPHVPYTCDFDAAIAGSWDPWLESRNDQVKEFAINHYTNAHRDLILNLTKR
jgi:hypothetical protein